MKNKTLKIVSMFLLLLAFNIGALNAQLITDFAGAASDDGGATTWVYTWATSRITGVEAPGDLIYGTPENVDFTGVNYVTLTANVVSGSAPNNGFSVVLEDGSGVLATAMYTWTSFVGGATVSSALVPSSGFNFSDVVGWSLVSGGSGSSVDATFTTMAATLAAIPEPQTYVLLILGFCGLFGIRYFKKWIQIS